MLLGKRYMYIKAILQLVTVLPSELVHFPFHSKDITFDIVSSGFLFQIIRKYCTNIEIKI